MNVDEQMNSTAETAGDLLPERNSSPSPSSSPSTSSLVLHPRREPFEYGLLPIPKLIFTDGTLTLSSIKDKLLSYTNPHSNKVTATFLAETLQIPVDQAELVIETLASVLPSGREEEVGGTANVYDLILLLYIQSYKRLLPRTHKDSVAVTDVWPSTSPFDGYLSALSPLQLVRTNSRRSMPSQADEEAHQLSFLQKHMVNILSLLAETVEGEGNETLAMSLERFEHLELLIQFRDKSSERIQLSQVAPFFANSDPDMPAAPVSVAQVHEWILQNISASLDHTTEKAPTKDNRPSTILDGDVTMADACFNYSKGQNNAAYSRSLTFIEGVSKASVVKKGCDIKGSTIKVLNCHESVIYILAPLRYATVYGCSDATIVLGAIGKAVRVEHCERVHIIAAAKRICIANCRECIFYLGVNQRPLILGDNHKLQVAPFNTFYVEMKEHMNKVRLHATISRWNEPLVLGMVDPHDSLSHPAGVSDVQAESATCLDPNQFTSFLIPNWFGTESGQPTVENPFPLPEEYMASLKRKSSAVEDIRQVINAAELDENKKKELASAFHAHFKDWLYATGNIRQLYCLQGD